MSYFVLINKNFILFDSQINDRQTIDVEELENFTKAGFLYSKFLCATREKEAIAKEAIAKEAIIREITKRLQDTMTTMDAIFSEHMNMMTALYTASKPTSKSRKPTGLDIQYE